MVLVKTALSESWLHSEVPKYDSRCKRAMPTRITLADEQLISLSETPDYLPRRRGKKVHISTIYRWVFKGARGKQLESVLLGGIRYTSLEAIQRFLGDPPDSLLEHRRQNQILDQLRRAGLTT